MSGSGYRSLHQDLRTGSFSKEKNRAKSYALKRLGERDYSTEELRKTLKKKEFTEKEIRAAILYCKKMGLLHDSLLAQKILQKVAESEKGALYARWTLGKKGIPPHIASSALKKYYPKEEELKRGRTLIGHTKKSERKGVRALLQRKGFSESAIEQLEVEFERDE